MTDEGAVLRSLDLARAAAAAGAWQAARHRTLTALGLLAGMVPERAEKLIDHDEEEPMPKTTTPNLAAARRAADTTDRLREALNTPAPKPVKPCQLHSEGGALVSDACPTAYKAPKTAA